MQERETSSIVVDASGRIERTCGHATLEFRLGSTEVSRQHVEYDLYVCWIALNYTNTVVTGMMMSYDELELTCDRHSDNVLADRWSVPVFQSISSGDRSCGNISMSQKN